MNTITVKANQKQWRVHIRDEADESVAAEIFSVHEYRIADEYLTKLTAPIFDIGAHSGLFTLYARAINREVPIIAIEPEPGNQALFKKHMSENEVSKVELLPAAVAETSGTMALAVSADSHNHRLVKKSDRNTKTIQVKTVTVPELLRQYTSGVVGLIKCDIEGGEYPIFLNLHSEVFEKIGAVIMEYHTISGHRYQEIEQVLREHGFGVQVFPSKFDKTMGFLWAVNKRLRVA